MTGCLQELEGQLQALAEACALRQERCKESWGLQKLRQELDQAEAWLASREGLLLDPNCGVSQGPTIDRLRDGSCGQGQVLVLLCSLNSHARLWTGRVRLLVPLGAGPHPDLLLPSTRWPMWSCCSMDTMT